MATIRHVKTNNVADWTQEQLNSVINGGAAPLPPIGTQLDDIVLPSDWNDDHVIEGLYEDINHLQFNTSPTPPTYAEGQVYWNPDDHCLNVTTDTADVTLQVGQETIVHAKNTSGGTISNGQAVYINGAVGASGSPTIALAQADTLDTARQIGIATADIADNGFGWVTLTGKVRGVDTSGYAEGVLLYLSADTAGGLTDTVPTFPNYRVPVAFCINSHAVNGTLLVFRDSPMFGAMDAGRVIFAGANGLLSEDAEFNYDATTNTLSAKHLVTQAVSADTENVLLGKNTSGTNTFAVTGAGDVTATSFTGDGSGLTGLPVTSPAGSNTQIQYNDSGVFGGDSLFTFDEANKVLGLGTATPRNSKMDIVAPAPIIVAGTGTIAPTQYFDDCIVIGTGTAFLSEVKKGDLIYNSAENLSAMVISVVNDTQLWVAGTGIGFMGAGSTFKIGKRIISLEDSNGFTSWVEASPTAYNSQTGVLDYNGRIFGGGYSLFANRNTPNSGVIIKQSASDGRMHMKHIQSSAYLQFQASGANITAQGLTLTGNSAWEMPFYLGFSGYSGGQTGVYLDRSGTGTGQRITVQTRIYALNGASPSLEVSANGMSFGRRDGSTWNEVIDDITLNMGATSGKWKFGSFGTSDPAEATARVHIVESTGYNQLRLETPYTPTSTADTNGNVGDVAWDDNYTYVKTSAGWKRSALSTF